MNKQQLQQEILSCVWSTGFRKYIKEHNYIFTSTELLSIAYHFAPTYNERLRLLQLLADQAPGVSGLAARCICFQKECLEQFCRHGENEVYELRIKDDPDAYDRQADELAKMFIENFSRKYPDMPEAIRAAGPAGK